MDERIFTSKISGSVRFNTDGMYTYFQPNELPFDIEFSKHIYRESTSAVLSLGNLNGRVSGMEEEERSVLFDTLTLKESVHSSSIEGTRSTIGDVYRSEKENVEGTALRDVEEVRNYIEALKYGVKAIQEGEGITVELIHRLHRILLAGTRGSDKSPGMFKTSQNAIGMPGDTLDTAKMVPAPPEAVERLMENLLEFLDSDEDPLIKIALAHYQFETIHPYRDGNGRIGRLLIMLTMVKEGLLTFPILYPSEYFDRNRDTYIDLLFGVSSADRFDEWLDFFIGAMKEQADGSARMIDALRSYKRKLESLCDTLAEKRLVDLLFRNPYVRVADVSSFCEISAPTAAKAIGKLVSAGALREITGRKKSRLYVADGILEILTGRRCTDWKPNLRGDFRLTDRKDGWSKKNTSEDRLQKQHVRWGWEEPTPGFLGFRKRSGRAFWAHPRRSCRRGRLPP
ncbi:MAG: Fic family protein [Candidatus Methanomethylophilaceae archaeon]|nr:Fic family protein [Candidatus Methanomethylophilaceae archaeon]